MCFPGYRDFPYLFGILLLLQFLIPVQQAPGTGEPAGTQTAHTLERGLETPRMDWLEDWSVFQSVRKSVSVEYTCFGRFRLIRGTSALGLLPWLNRRPRRRLSIPSGYDSRFYSCHTRTTDDVGLESVSFTVKIPWNHHKVSKNDFKNDRFLSPSRVLSEVLPANNVSYWEWHNCMAVFYSSTFTLHVYQLYNVDLLPSQVLPELLSNDHDIRTAEVNIGCGSPSSLGDKDSTLLSVWYMYEPSLNTKGNYGILAMEQLVLEKMHLDLMPWPVEAGKSTNHQRCMLNFFARFVYREVTKWIKMIYYGTYHHMFCAQSVFREVKMTLICLTMIFGFILLLQILKKSRKKFFCLLMQLFLQMQVLKIWQSSNHLRCVVNTCARFSHHDECWGFAPSGEWLSLQSM